MRFLFLIALTTFAVLFSPAFAKKRPAAKRSPNASVGANDIPSLPAKGQRVILTFDDGVRLNNTPKILDFLEKYGVRAIFFVNGWLFENETNPDHKQAREILKEIHRRGHLIGNHTIHHFNLCTIPLPKSCPLTSPPTVQPNRATPPALCVPEIDKAEREITENARLIEQAVGAPPPLFRAPFGGFQRGGGFCPRLTSLLTKLHLTNTLWDIDSQDYALKNANLTFQHIRAALGRQRVREKPIVLLMHDFRPEVIQTLQLLFDYQAQTKDRWTFAHPSELFDPSPTMVWLRKTWKEAQSVFPKLIPPWTRLFFKYPPRPTH